MASPPELPDNNHNIARIIQSATSNFFSVFNPPKPTPSSPSKICVPLLFAHPPQRLTVPFHSLFESTPDDSVSSKPTAIRGAASNPGLPSTVRISGLNSNGKSGGDGGGPVFVGQVFSMCDLSGTGLMAVSTHLVLKLQSLQLSLSPSPISNPSMASPPELPDNNHNIARIIQSATSNFFSVFNPPKPTPSSPSKICVPLLFAHPPQRLTVPFHSLFESTPDDSVSSKPTAIRGAASNPGLPSTVRISGLNSNGKSGGDGGGPVFVGQVFSMCDLSGTGLMAVSTHFDIPFISKRTPEWLKKIFASVTKSERNGPVFRFFMDLGDAVSYVKRLNIPSGVVGACRLDLAYEHFKEKPHLFQFIPNEKQVKAANKLLKTIPDNDGRQSIDGVPVFSVQNLEIAIASADGIKWYTPYFFDKNMLDNILEESVDQHFHSLIQTRHLQRRRDVIDDNLAAEVIEEMGDSLSEPPEVQEVIDEMGNPGIPLSVISKAAEMQLSYAVDKVLLGNRCLRKATGIQPKFPYMVDSFEKRSAASFLRASESINRISNSETVNDCKDSQHLGTSELNSKDNFQSNNLGRPNFQFPFGDWFGHLWSRHQCRREKGSDTRTQGSPSERIKQKLQPNPFLPKITMVGISTGEAGQMSKSTLKKTMEELTRELEQTEEGNVGDEFKVEDRDPLFVANVGDYYSGMARAGSGRWVRGGNKL